MSRQMNNNNRNAASARKPFCKVCHDAGKPESDYTSHHVRSLPDKQGNTTILCPTLLNTECRYCYGLGHTAKFCPAIASRKKADERANREEKRRQSQQLVQKPKEDLRGGGFRVLMDDDDEAATHTPTPVMEEFPALGAPSKRVEMTGYAAAAAKPVPIVAAKSSVPTGFKVLQKGAAYEKTEVPKPTFVTRKVTNWADWDTDDEEEDRKYAAEYVDNSAW